MEQSPIKITQNNEGQLLEKPLVKPMQGVEGKPGKPILTIMLVILTISAGLASGYLLNKRVPAGQNQALKSGEMVSSKDEVKKGNIYGIEDREIYPDKTEGTLVVNDKSFTDEGSHILIQEKNNPSRNAYLTSTVLDLNLFVGRKVEVWGETFAAQKAGWLMDVGTIKVLD